MEKSSLAPEDAAKILPDDIKGAFSGLAMREVDVTASQFLSTD